MIKLVIVVNAEAWEELKWFILTAGSCLAQGSHSSPVSYCREEVSDVLGPRGSSEENSSVLFQIQLLEVSEHCLC